MKHRGLYGQSEGNDNRSSADFMVERMDENERIEGHHVAALRRMFSERDWTNYNNKITSLLKEGFKQNRIDSMVARASAGLKL